MRPGDLPREELMQRATEMVEGLGGEGRVEVFFKFDCAHCGTRCQLAEPNKLYERGECCKCGKETEITHGGFSLAVNIPAQSLKG